MENAIRILVVDDEETLCDALAFNLQAEGYVADTAYSAEDALAMNLAGYDLVLLDIMMGEISGLQLARIMKANPVTAHVPVIFCTAKDSEDDMIHGLDLGADDYMTKPFNVDELRLRVTKLLRLRRRGAGRALIEPEPQSIAITSLDEKLIERAVGYVEENMSRADLSVEELAAEMGMSRVHLYKRLKQITGKTPIEFIRLLRLKRAAQLLRESQLNISEIAYRCGFNNPKYFSRYFKDEFGVLPSVYQENEGK